jgi:CNT family concentrative nucleoside transporter
MAASDGHHAHVQGHDTIEFSAPVSAQPPLEKQPSTGSSGAGVGTDDKNASYPVEQQYGVDSEKQSERVGSLQARSHSERERGPLAAMWHRHWKNLAQLVAFMVFTASVTPFRQHCDVACLSGTPS